MKRLTERYEENGVQIKDAGQYPPLVGETLVCHRLADIEDILGDDYDLDRLRELQSEGTGMSDYIDRDSITRAFRETDPDLFTEYDEHYGVESGYSHEVVESIIAGLPAADVAQVVHCKNCRYYQDAKTNPKGFLICPASGMEITETDYCSYGEQMYGKDDEHEAG